MSIAFSSGRKGMAMIFSRTSQYAIQALTYIAAQPRGGFVLNRQIADALEVPSPYLAKVLQDLCQAELLESARGRLGGFCLTREAESTSIMNILLTIEGSQVSKECIMGLKECGDETACPIHRKWKPIKQEIIALLDKLTLKDLARGVSSGKYHLGDLPERLPRH
jgi:Rrf2 family protein